MVIRDYDERRSSIFFKCSFAKFGLFFGQIEIFKPKWFSKCEK